MEAAAVAGVAGATALAREKWHEDVVVVLGPPATGAHGLELTVGEGEVRRTRGRKE